MHTVMVLFVYSGSFRSWAFFNSTNNKCKYEFSFRTFSPRFGSAFFPSTSQLAELLPSVPFHATYSHAFLALSLPEARVLCNIRVWVCKWVPVVPVWIERKKRYEHCSIVQFRPYSMARWLFMSLFRFGCSFHSCAQFEIFSIISRFAWTCRCWCCCCCYGIAHFLRRVIVPFGLVFHFHGIGRYTFATCNVTHKMRNNAIAANTVTYI